MNSDGHNDLSEVGTIDHRCRCASSADVRRGRLAVTKVHMRESSAALTAMLRQKTNDPFGLRRWSSDALTVFDHTACDSQIIRADLHQRRDLIGVIGPQEGIDAAVNFRAPPL